MEKKIIDISLKASYIKIGTISKRTKNIWLIFHGYGQLAEEFCKLFNEFEEEENYLIFPQGLSKFYLKGIGNKIGANWMTSHDRELDISNYIAYLNQLYDHEIKPFKDQVELNILGFSQGGHTASRWIHSSNIKYEKLIMWGAGLAIEIDKDIILNSFSQSKNITVIGDNDRFISTEQFNKMAERYERIGFKYQLIEYQGGHEIYPEVLKNIF